jgi:hypothetical protein
VPLLRAGYLVLCDRYVFTAYAHRNGSGIFTASPHCRTSRCFSRRTWRCR